ncbi:hypothetical protein EMCRGX_G034630 [Ephydatia muelleri]
MGSGTVVTAHCTCMAGLGEVCSHIGAVLFKVEACINPALVVDIDFNRPKRLKPTTLQKADNYNDQLQLDRRFSSVSIEPHISACSAMETRLPQPLSYLYNGQNRLLPKEQLSDLVQHTTLVQHNTLTVNDKEACYLERSTRGLLEIKCPFKYRNSQPASIEDESFYLHKVGSEVTLDKKHDYYYQVQGQMAIWKKPYCDFIC